MPIARSGTTLKISKNTIVSSLTDTFASKTQLDSLSSTVGTKFLAGPASATAQQVLTYNGSTSTWVASAAPAGVGSGASNITSGTVVTLTTQTSVDFTGIPSWVKKVTVIIAGVSTNGTSIPKLLLGTSIAVASTGYLACVYGESGASISTTATTDGFYFRDSAWSSTVLANGIFTFCNISSNTWVCNGGGLHLLVEEQVVEHVEILHLVVL